ncbi:hypothetical protein GJ686_17125 [Klebsiella variicola]|uniref:hypothetical protein n=1 Tax=Klebsiella variicola TaxID=244366 RepID=UPI0012DFD7A1|nr:hypothetical protein [Klebsiella variicola]HED4008589.1 hypothetical protein [Klebsiella variicola subsp. variicola]EIV7249134.1 hypothetical protein [Klebsiella variicola]EIY5006249.1 hypothetical protein [Klebsiella variicola]MUM51253.1 hypothetical protein [Klebsiella variicola]MUM56300.1 hypothetical protein [Klebsiella variicola]
MATVICGLEIPRWRCAYRGYGYLRPGNPTVALRLPWLRLSAAWKSHGGATLTVATVICRLEIPRWRYAYRGYGYLPPGNPTVALRLLWLRLSAAWKSHGGAALTVATVFAVK